MKLIPEILAAQAEIQALRRDIHAHPELCFEEQRTSDLVAAKLAEWGIEVHRGLGKTGLVGVIRNGEGQRIGLRADNGCAAIGRGQPVRTPLQARRKNARMRP